MAIDWGMLVEEGLKAGLEKIEDFLKDRFGMEGARIVEAHAIGSAAASIAAMFPGAGPTVCIAAQTTLIYSMYVRLNRVLNIPLSKNKIKSIASAVVANLASNAGVYLLGTAAATVLSFIPFIGSGASSLIMCALGYAAVVISAITYGGILEAIANKKEDELTKEKIEELVREDMASRDINQEMKDLMGDYRNRRKSGEITGKESISTEE